MFNLIKVVILKKVATNVGKFVAPVAGLYLFRAEGFRSDSNNQNASGTTTIHFTKMVIQ